MRIQSIQPRRARIEMVPLIDMIFLLLVFFMYAMLSMTVHKGVKVELPEAGKPAPDSEHYVTVSIDKAGALFVQSQPVTLDNLVPSVKDAMATAKEQKVVIDGDKNASLGIGVKVLEKLSHVEDIKVSFSVKEEKSDGP